MENKEKVLRRFRVGLAAGVSCLGGAGVVLFGPAGVVILGASMGLVVVGFAWAVVFSPRDEPSRRLVKLIKAVWRRD
jgi:hypothetical protein